jgi:hypothetical protein
MIQFPPLYHPIVVFLYNGGFESKIVIASLCWLGYEAVQMEYEVRKTRYEI